ncbi:short-chain dehydrogenase [Karstenula rhodostoma CBS 690.94]|uniref:Short-chain dehydrogenase n=1 Tax=Karstenula rhodostoma CBS 690.94 TaxID=1392251 RepID=A0A9P4PKH6_9PLEO|nr:short-chain dehydrogenase [Karstenula rhodostoma CBS 690.94]
MSPPEDLTNLPTPHTEAHKPENLRGAGDARPTALQILNDQDLIGKLSGKVALVTGVSSGLGIETARALMAAGMHVHGAVRNLDKAREVLKDDLKPGKLDLIHLDNNSLSSVRAGAADFLSRCSTLNVLVNNAGVMMAPEGRTEDGFETQFGVNHLAHFLLFQLLKPTLLASASPSFGSRVVNVSSSGHHDGPRIFFDNINLEGIYDPRLAYGQSKLANIQMGTEIERRYGAQHLHAFSVMPGVIATGIGQFLPKELIESWLADEGFMRALKSPEQGAATQVWAAVGKELEGIGGAYLEDCHVAEQAVEGNPHFGYTKAAYDEVSEKKLWKISCEMVGAKED